MSADDGPPAGSPPVGDAFVAALGFEPTDGLMEDSSTSPSGDHTDGLETNGSGSNDLPATTDVAESPMSSPPDPMSSPQDKEPEAFDPTADATPLSPPSAGPATPLVFGSGNGDEATAGDTVPTVAVLGGALTDESPVNPGLHDGYSSGVKPIPATVDVGVITPTDDQPPPPDPDSPIPAAGPVTVPVSPLTVPAVGPVTLSMAPQAEATPQSPQPVMPAATPLVVESLTTGPTLGVGAFRRRAVSLDAVAERVGGLTARIPHLLEDGVFRRSRRLRARKVRRVIRHIDPWSVLTFSVLFHLCVFAALLLSSVLVWNAAVAAGTIENIESFIRELGDYTTYEINGDVVFRAAMVITGILTLASSVLVVLLTVVFNLISDLVGGIRVTVVEEETVRVRRKRNQ